jgi:hypothetical protein
MLILRIQSKLITMSFSYGIYLRYVFIFYLNICII